MGYFIELPQGDCWVPEGLWNNLVEPQEPFWASEGGQRPVRILVADDHDEVRATLVRMSQDMGHEVVGEARDGEEAVALARETAPELLLLDIRMPKMDGMEVARALIGERPIAIVIVTAYADDALIEEAAEVGVFSYVVKPVTRPRLAAAVSTARARFADLQVLRDEVGGLKEALEARKLVERAKGIIMRDLEVGEQEAYRWLKKTSSHSNHKLADVARRIVALETDRRL